MLVNVTFCDSPLKGKDPLYLQCFLWMTILGVGVDSGNILSGTTWEGPWESARFCDLV